MNFEFTDFSYFKSFSLKILFLYMHAMCFDQIVSTTFSFPILPYLP